MIDPTVQGAEQFGDVAAQLKRLDGDNRDLRRDLYRGLNRAVKPLIADTRESAERKLPRRGGLARRVAAAKMSSRRRTGKNPGIAVVAKGMDQLRGMDQGTVRHPVYGNRNVWVTQSISPGWFSEPVRAGADEARTEISRVLDEIAREIARRS